MCALMANVLSAQVKIGENKLESSPHHWLEIDNTDSLFIVTRQLELGLTDNPHRLGITPNPATDAIMLKLYGYGLNQFLPALIGPASQDVELISGIESNIFLGITEDGSVLEVPMRLVIKVDTATAELSFHNGIDTFGTADLTVLDSIFATDSQLADSTALLRTLISNVQNSDMDTITGNEYIDSIRLSNDTIHFIENLDGRLAPRNDQFVDLGPLLQGATFYLSDGVLEEDRTVTGDGNWLRFEGLDSFEVNANSFVVLNGNQTTIQQGGQDIIQINAAEEVKFRSGTVDSILVLDEDGSLHAAIYGDTSIIGNVATIIAADSDGNLIETTIEEILAGDADSTIYTHDGTLVEDRVLTGAGFDLDFDGVGTFDINADSVQLSSVVQGDGFGVDDTETFSTIIGSTPDGVLIDVDPAEILATQPDSTIYTHDGTLVEDRVLTGAGFDLDFDGVGTFDINADSVQLSNVVQGDGFGVDDTETFTTIIGSTADGVLIDIDVDEVLASQEDSTIYTHDGTLAEDRVLTGAGFDLDFDGVGTFDINADSVQLSSVVQGDGFGVDDTETFSTIIGSTPDGVLIDVDPAEILATQPDSTIYTHDGTLVEDRVLTGAGFDLDFDGIGTFDINADSVQLSNVVQGDGFGVDDTETFTTIIGSTADGVLIDIDVNEVLAAQEDSTIYTHDGTLTDQRFMTMGTVATPHDLHFVSPDDADTIVITSDGRMAIGRSFVMTGTGTAEDIRLDVDGDILAIQVHASSDARFKKNISQVENALDKVLAIEGVTYNFKTEEFTNRNFPTKSQLGFLAQNVEEVIPQVVKTDAYGYKSIDYSKLTALLNEAIKEQQSQINELNGELQTVIDLNNQLLEEIRQIRKDFKAMSDER